MPEVLAVFEDSRYYTVTLRADRLKKGEINSQLEARVQILTVYLASERLLSGYVSVIDDVIQDTRKTLLCSTLVSAA